MKRMTDRRTILLAAGTTAMAAVTGAAAAQSSQISGTVTYEGGTAIPKGQIVISLDGKASPDTARTAPQPLESNGKSTAVDFAIPLPARAANSAPAEIVVQLLREDGWLLARGSAALQPGKPVEVTLYTVMY